MFKDGRMLVAYAAFSHHCSFFPLSASILDRFRKELSGYETSRGTIRFTVDNPLPASLVKKIVRERLKQNRLRDRMKTLKTAPGLPSGLAQPARRALSSAGIHNLRQLSKWKESDLRRLHGLGKHAISLLKKAMKGNDISFMPV